MAQPPSRNDDEDPDFDGSMLELVAEAVGFIVGIYELDEDLVYLSAEWSRLTAGRSGPSFLPSEAFRALIHPDDATRMSLALAECMRGGSPFFEVDLRIRALGGQWKPRLMQARVTDRDAFGQAVRIMAVMFDIERDRPDAAQDLTLQQYFRASFEHSQIGIMIGTPEGSILAANPAASRLTGYTLEELQARGRDGLLDPADPRLAIFLRRRRLLGHNSGQVRLLCKDGQKLDAEIGSVLYVDAQGMRRNVISLRPCGKADSALELERTLKWLQVRKQCTRAIIRSRSADALLAEVCRVLCEVLELPLVWIGQLEASTLTVAPRLSHGPESAFLEVAWFSADARVEEGGGPVGRALRSGHGQALDDVQCDPEAQPWHALAERHNMRSLLALPLAANEAEPMLLVLHGRERAHFSHALADSLAELAREIAFALENQARDAALKESEQRFRTLWESALDAIVILDSQAIVHYANPMLTRLFGHRIEEVMGRNFSMLFSPDDKLGRERLLLRSLASQQGARAGQTLSGMARRKDGSLFPVELTLGQASIDGQPRQIAHVRDVSQRHRSERLSARQNAILRAIADGQKRDHTLEALARLVEDETEGWRCAFLLPAEDASPGRAIAPSLSQAQCARIRVQAAAIGSSLPRGQAPREAQWPLLVGVAGSDTEPPPWMWVDAPGQSSTPGASQLLQMVLDLAALAVKAHAAEQRIRRLAQCDELTGLANRAAMIQSLERALARARRDGSSVGLLLIDLDDFQRVNQRHGQQAGDQVLQELAARMQQAVRRGDMLARWNGDGFLVLMERVKGEAALSRVAAKLQKMLAAPLAAAPGTQLAASIGICCAPQDGEDCNTLLRQAKLAMLAARTRGGACHVRAATVSADESAAAPDGPQSQSEKPVVPSALPEP